MVSRIKTKKTWQRHLPQRPTRTPRGYYSEHKGFQKKKVVRIIWIILIILLVQSIFQAKYFQVDKIEIIGQEDLRPDEVYELINPYLEANKFLFFKNNNYFLLSEDRISRMLLEKFNLEEATVQKVFPDQLKISIREKISYFIWQKDDSLYLLDAQGALNRQISVLDDKYLVLQDLRDYRPNTDQIFTEDEISVINQIYLVWQELIDSQPKLDKIIIYNDWSLELYTDIGFYVKIDKDGDIREQLGNLERVLSENITGVDVDYIDVRFGDKVYFK